MKVWVLAGLFTIAMAPAALAVEDISTCDVDDTRQVSEQRDEAAAPVAQTVARPTVAQRTDTVSDAAEPAPRQPVERRRSVKRIPDAQLIGPRGAL